MTTSSMSSTNAAADRLKPKFLEHARCLGSSPPRMKLRSRIEPTRGSQSFSARAQPPPDQAANVLEALLERLPETEILARGYAPQRVAHTRGQTQRRR
jgi:hypothetical protein